MKLIINGFLLVVLEGAGLYTQVYGHFAHDWHRWPAFILMNVSPVLGYVAVIEEIRRETRKKKESV